MKDRALKHRGNFNGNLVWVWRSNGEPCTWRSKMVSWFIRQPWESKSYVAACFVFFFAHYFPLNPMTDPWDWFIFLHENHKHQSPYMDPMGICIKLYSSEKWTIVPWNINGWFRCLSYWNIFVPLKRGHVMIVFGGVFFFWRDKNASNWCHLSNEKTLVV